MNARRRRYAGDEGANEALAEAQVAMGEIVLLMQEALDLVERSEFRDHLYDVAGRIIEKLPQEVIRARDKITEARGALVEKGKKAYSPPAGDLAGVQTLVRRDEDTSEGVSDHDRTRERALPQKSDRSPGQDRRQPLDTGGESEVTKQYINVPPGTGGADEGLSKTRTRQRPQPGEERGSPYKDTALLTRRTMEGWWRGTVRQAMSEVYGR